MNPKHLKELLHASPFEPFSLVLATGKIFRVDNPDVLSVTIKGRILYDDVEGPSTFINPLLISEIVMLTGGQGS